MTTEYSSDLEVPEETATTRDENIQVIPELETIIREVLEQNDGLCMDEPEEREQLAAALVAALRTDLNDKPEDGDTETKAST